MTSWLMDESYSLGVWPHPKSLGSFCGMEEVPCSVVVDLFCSVFQPQVSHQMRDSRVEPWVGAFGKQKSGLNLGPRDMSTIMASNVLDTERTY